MKRPWRKQEDRLARKRKGKRRPFSGGGALKEDVADAVGLGQCKSTKHASIRLHRDDLIRLRINAATYKLLPYAEILFRQVNPLNDLRVYIVFHEEFHRYFPKEG